MKMLRKMNISLSIFKVKIDTMSDIVYLRNIVKSLGFTVTTEDTRRELNMLIYVGKQIAKLNDKDSISMDSVKCYVKQMLNSNSIDFSLDFLQKIQ